MASRSTRSRKGEHLRIAIEGEASRASLATGLDEVRLVPEALPEMRLADVDTRIELFGRRLAAPIVISSMTGGTSQGRTLNRRLARVAERCGLAMGLGSQRAMLEDPRAARTYEVRDVAPTILLFGNLGAVQLNYGVTVEECKRLVEAVGADVLSLHLNALQEAMQPEGQTDFSGLVGKIADVKRGLGKPVVVKEVGFGVSARAAQALAGAGVDGIDVAGAGGTNWSRIEGARRAASPRRRALAEAFAGWGIPTARSLVEVRGAWPRGVVIASGGIRTGLDVAKAIALGADAVGVGLPFLQAAARSEAAVVDLVETIVEGLKIAMFLTGAARVADLRKARVEPAGSNHLGGQSLAR